MKISARNVLKGRVKRIEPVGAEIVSIITKHSAEDLALATGKDVYAVIKASNAMVAVDH